MSEIQLSNALVTVNNNPILHLPNTVMFTEGLGEQKMRPMVVGGGLVEIVYSEDRETNISKMSFEMPATIDLIEEARTWKLNKNQNLVQITGETSDGKTLTRSLSGAALLTDYEVNLGSETSINMEFMGNPVV